MKNFRYFFCLNLIMLLLTSCASVKEGFTNQKKNNSDEFLVEKKSPLILPPNYDELPIPKQNKMEESQSDDEIKSLITNTDVVRSDNSQNKNEELEESLLEKIKSN